MNFISNTIHRLNIFQQKHSWAGFPYAVIKKYGDDQAGQQAALLTYYGFLALFPLLLVLTTLLSIFAGSHEALRKTVIEGLTDYFPMFGTQLSGHIGGIHKSGLPLVIGIVFTLYGARGVADAFRMGVNHIWEIPRAHRDSFFTALAKSLGIVIVGGTGFMVASIISGYAAAAGHGVGFRLLSMGINMFILFWLFMFLMNVSLPRHVTLRETGSGAATAAIGLVILQSLGGIIFGP